MGNSKTLFCSSKLPWASERIYSEFVTIWACVLKNFRPTSVRVTRLKADPHVLGEAQSLKSKRQSV